MVKRKVLSARNLFAVIICGAVLLPMAACTAEFYSTKVYLRNGNIVHGLIIGQNECDLKLASVGDYAPNYPLNDKRAGPQATTPFALDVLQPYGVLAVPYTEIDHIEFPVAQRYLFEYLVSQANFWDSLGNYAPPYRDCGDMDLTNIPKKFAPMTKEEQEERDKQRKKHFKGTGSF